MNFLAAVSVMPFNMRTLSTYIATPQSGSSSGVATRLNPGRHPEGVQRVP